MEKDEVAEAVEKALLETKDKHDLSEDESMRLSVLVSVVARSSQDIRGIFYTSVIKISKYIKTVLQEKQKTILDKIKKNVKKNILN